MSDVGIGVLQRALSRWQTSGPAPALELLGYEVIRRTVPPAGLVEFGLEREADLHLTVEARHRSFVVLHVRLERPPDAESIRGIAAALYRHNPARRALLLFTGPGACPVIFASWGLGPGPFRLRRLRIDPANPRRPELEMLAGLAVEPGIAAAELALAHGRALDREQVTRRFFNEFRRRRAELAAAILGVPLEAREDRLEIALILMGRLLFLYFVQRKGWLANDAGYLRRLFAEALRGGVPFYRRRLKPLFFEALSRPLDQRSPRALELGTLPYLNGGLFEREPVERRHPRLDIPDEAFQPVFDELFERYQFTVREDQPADQDIAIDPEMLGQVFEGLMSSPTRSDTGAFYTPRVIVEGLVDDALGEHLARATDCSPERVHEILAGSCDRLEPTLRSRLLESIGTLRVLDPAVGSGAFLLTALRRIETLHDGLEAAVATPRSRFRRRQEIIERNLFGVDINPAAVRLCELRLWLALIVDLEVSGIEEVPPLPNLDLKIRQGDALLDPIDFVMEIGRVDDRNLTGRWRRAVNRLEKRRARYFRAAGREKRRAGRSLRRAERRLALTFLGELRGRCAARAAELQGLESATDLFGQRPGLGRGQKRTLIRLERRAHEIDALIARIEEEDELPFFSFAIHFVDPAHPERGFDVILGNPPWVRSHRWAAPARARLKERFACLRNAGWRLGARLGRAGHGFGTQLDLSAIFVERALDLLGAEGVLGFLVPAKLTRALYAGALRQRLLTTTRLLRLEDASLASRRLFHATTYPLALVASSGSPEAGCTTNIQLHTASSETLTFRRRPRDLPIRAGDLQAPWVLAPNRVHRLLERMQATGSPLGAWPGGGPARGIVTGLNSVFVGKVVREPGPGGLARLLLDGREVEIESRLLRPTLRGADLRAWHARPGRVLLFTHDDDGRVLPLLPPAAHRYLEERIQRLRRRRDLRPHQPPWSLFRTDPAKWGPRVVWRDIGRRPAAAVLPARVPFLGSERPVISLNTVYQVPTSDEQEAHFLTALLNSTPALALLRAVAERASGRHFRFLGWTVGLLPIPVQPDPALRAACIEISRHAHAGDFDSDARRWLDDVAGRLYGLDDRDGRVLREFAARLVGQTNGEA